MIKLIVATSEQELNRKHDDFIKDNEVINKYFSVTNNGAYCFAIEYKEVSNERAINTRAVDKRPSNTGNKKPRK